MTQEQFEKAIQLDKKRRQIAMHYNALQTDAYDTITIADACELIGQPCLLNDLKDRLLEALKLKDKELTDEFFNI